MKPINILGQLYNIRKCTEEEFPKLKILNADGACELYSKEIILNKVMEESDPQNFDNFKEYKNKVLRHEIMHAFFHESGLNDYCRDEELVDWLAIQMPKIVKVMIGHDLI